MFVAIIKIGITLAVTILAICVSYTAVVAINWLEARSADHWYTVLREKRDTFYDAFDACEAARRKMTSTN